MASHPISCLRGNTFVVSDVRGDVVVDPDSATGLFHRDMRHLSRWQLTLDGVPLDPLSHDRSGYPEIRFFLAGPGSNVYDNATVAVIRSRRLDRGEGEDLHEDLTVVNGGAGVLVVNLSLHFDADFADLFEVKDRQLTKQGSVSRAVHDDRVELIYRRGDFVRSTVVEAPGATVSQGTATFLLRLEPGRSWSSTVRVRLGSSAPERRPSRVASTSRAAGGHAPERVPGMADWLASAPRLRTGWDTLRHTYDRSLRDLAALRLHPRTLPDGATMPAAGLPWFLAVFGRDSLVTSFQALPFKPELAAATLQALAARQATRRDDFRDAEPGKILHELRFGELTYFDEWPQSPYYGSADATPLFLVLLEEYERWSGDVSLVRRLEPQARAALRWLEEYGDLDGDGYLEYRSRNDRHGLVNQCWKDSWNSIVHPDGTLATLPRATCELQGYAYDARRRTARLAREVWGDPDLADRLETDAASLKVRFNRDFWVEDGACYALALDGDKRQVSTLTSNMGQLLWSGIVEDDRVDAVVAHLMGEDLFSGWGVRTLASGQRAYNPLGYHIGTVWPHDNSLIAAGLARYGRHEEAGRIAYAVLEAAAAFDHRLPEVFAGFPRALTRFPVEYPTACSPQAWAAATPLLLVRTLLGLEPGPSGPVTDPHVPEPIGPLSLTGVPGRWTTRDE